MIILPIHITNTTQKAKHSDLPWDFVLAGDLMQTYKPNPKTYTTACSLLSLPPSSVAMVAAHLYDMEHAKKIGMSTIYIRRPTEDTTHEGKNGKEEELEYVDIVVDGFEELAELLGCGEVGQYSTTIG